MFIDQCDVGVLVVDNCEHMLEGATEMVSRILESAREVNILVTSREPLGLPGEAVLRVPALGLEPTGPGRSVGRRAVCRAGRSSPGRLVAERRGPRRHRDGR